MNQLDIEKLYSAAVKSAISQIDTYLPKDLAKIVQSYWTDDITTKVKFVVSITENLDLTKTKIILSAKYPILFVRSYKIHKELYCVIGERVQIKIKYSKPKPNCPGTVSIHYLDAMYSRTLDSFDNIEFNLNQLRSSIPYWQADDDLLINTLLAVSHMLAENKCKV